MASRTLDSGADHKSRVRVAEMDSRLADMIRGDFQAFQSAFISLEDYLQDFWRILNLDPAAKESLGALFTEQRKQSKVTNILFNNVVSRYDRFLNLVTYLHPHCNECLIKIVQLLNYTNLRMVEGMKELAELNHRITEQSAEQAQSMAVIAHDTKRDSEVMKAVTVVTLIFLPATFVSVGPIPRQESTAYPVVFFQTIFSMGFFSFDQSQIIVSQQGWIYAACALPLTCVVLGVSFAWIIWTGRKEEKPMDNSAGRVLVKAALGAGRRKEGV